MLWENLREEEFKEAIEKSKGVCIIPIGSLEKHGQHLPVGMDSIAAAKWCELAAEKEYAVEPVGVAAIKASARYSKYCS